jgi:hypothetical protein
MSKFCLALLSCVILIGCSDAPPKKRVSNKISYGDPWPNDIKIYKGIKQLRSKEISDYPYRAYEALYIDKDKNLVMLYTTNVSIIVDPDIEEQWKETRIYGPLLKHDPPNEHLDGCTFRTEVEITIKSLDSLEWR